MRAAGDRRRAGAYLSGDLPIVTPWHTHDMHQLLYAFEGSVELEDAGARYLLPSQLAGWIPAGVAHRTSILRRRSGSVFFAPGVVDDPGDRIRIVRVSPLMRAMVETAMRWPIDAAEDVLGRSYFETMGLLCREWLADEAPFHLPTAADPGLRAAMDFTRARPADVTLGDVCRHAGLSERSLRRRFVHLAGMSWRDYRHRCRLLRAMTLLGEGRAVGAVAAEVGFESLSAFAKAFAAYTGESPRLYRRRVAGR